MSQLQLLNTTVSSIAITMNTILSACYHACYDEGVSDEDELVLVTAPISATSEVEALYNSGILDWKTAIPAALHSLGCTSTEITEALRRRQEQQDKAEQDKEGNKTSDGETKKIASEQGRANVEQTRANTERTRAETARVSQPEKPAAEKA